MNHCMKQRVDWAKWGANCEVGKINKSKISSPLAWGGALLAVLRAFLYSFRTRPRIMKSCKSKGRTIADSLPCKSDLLSQINYTSHWENFMNKYVLCITFIKPTYLWLRGEINKEAKPNLGFHQGFHFHWGKLGGD